MLGKLVHLLKLKTYHASAIYFEESLEEISGEPPDQEIAEAKPNELEIVEDLQEDEDIRQFRISCTWIVWKKDYKTGVWFIARGCEESGEDSSDSPTLRMLI